MHARRGLNTWGVSPDEGSGTRRLIPVQQPGDELQPSSIWLHSFQGTFAFLAKGPLCNPCLQITHLSGRAGLHRVSCENRLKRRDANADLPFAGLERGHLLRKLSS